MAQTKRVLEHDAATGTTEYYHFDDVTGESIIETVQDATALIERNKRLYNDSTGRWGEMAMVASYPMTVLMDLIQQQILDAGFRVINQKEYKRWLSDPDNRVWRTKGGKV